MPLRIVMCMLYQTNRCAILLLFSMLRTLFIVAILRGYLSRAILPPPRLHLWKGSKVSFELCNICAKRIQRTRISKYKRGAENMRAERKRWERTAVESCRNRIGNYKSYTRFNGRFFICETNRMDKIAFPNEHFFSHERIRTAIRERKQWVLSRSKRLVTDNNSFDSRLK